MKKILIILDGIVAKKLMHRIVEANTNDNAYDVIYMSDLILPVQKPSNFTFYKFDPTSKSKLAMVLDKNIHTEVLIALNSKDEMINVIKNIREHKQNLQMNVLDYWGLEVDDPHVNVYKGIEVLANGMVERLPNIPVVAQNIGLKQGEIMEIRIPFGSSYAYRYIGSIEQKKWKIFALYRNQQLLTIKPSLVLKPNDVILVVGKPYVLMQVFNAIGKNQGQFPMPFGHNIYLYLDLYLQDEESVKKAILEAKYLNQRLKNGKLIVRITRPTTVGIMNFIKDELRHFPTITLRIDYANSGLFKILREDFRRFDIGMIILTQEMFKDKEAIAGIINLKIPVFKLGKEKLKSIKNTVVLLNDTASYEQISPMVFDVASQIKTKTKIFDLDPIGEEEDKSNLLDHFENLAKIFNEKVEIISTTENPIRKLKKEKNMLQILPLKKEMFKKRFSFKFIYTNTDFISFDMNQYNQLLIPVVEEQN
ncbi:COG3400 family protein [Arcobacter sp. YIC-464]|uniref:COG3400 family protein n=1 Tax=Arcobacter sp. YIC-464 TaxID=3376631 RepID=UPI003C16AC49